MPKSHEDDVQKHANQLTSIITSNGRLYITDGMAGPPTFMPGPHTFMGDLFPREVENGLGVILTDIKGKALLSAEAYAQKLRRIESLKADIKEMRDQIKEARLNAPDPANLQSRRSQIKKLRTFAHKLRRKSIQWGSGCAAASLIDLIICVAVFNALDFSGGALTTLMSWGAALASMLLLGVGADWGILRALYAARENGSRSGLEKKLSVVALVVLLIVSFGLAFLRTSTLDVEGATAWVVWIVSALGLPIIALGGAYCFKTVVAIETERRQVVQDMELHAYEMGGRFSSSPGTKEEEKSLRRLEKELGVAQRQLGEFLEEQVAHLVTSSVRQAVRALAETWALSERTSVGAARTASNGSRSKSAEENHG